MRHRLDWTRDKKGVGWLCIVYTDSLWSKPEEVSHWWPCWPATQREAQENWGAPCEAQDGGSGLGVFNLPSLFPGAYGAGRSVRLKDGESTQPIRTDTKPLPPPKTRVETRYRNGRWR